jgi:hypothetical protein
MINTGLKWEIIDEYHQRTMVPGGWLVKAFEDVSHRISSGWDFRIAMCFVPDPQRIWKLPKEEPKEEIA